MLRWAQSQNRACRKGGKRGRWPKTTEKKIKDWYGAVGVMSRMQRPHKMWLRLLTALFEQTNKGDLRLSPEVGEGCYWMTTTTKKKPQTKKKTVQLVYFSVNSFFKVNDFKTAKSRRHWNPQRMKSVREWNVLLKRADVSCPEWITFQNSETIFKKGLL